MKLRTAGAILSAGVLAVTLGVGTPPASALDASADNPAAQDAPGAPNSADMRVALQRDLHLTPDQAITRLAAEAAASRVEQELLGELGTGSGGAWLAEEDQRLVVTITDPGLAPLVRARVAEPRLVTRSAAELDALLTRLDRVPAPPTVAAWYVDVQSNTVVIEALPGHAAAARQFARAAGLDTTSVRVDSAASRPTTFDDVRGGEEFMNVGLVPCSIGFSVVGGFVSAGHCLDAGDRVYAPDFSPMGTIRGWTYPGKDHGWVDVFPEFTPRPLFRYWSGYLSVTNADVATIGSSVCRSGIVTGFRCGIIKARNVTVNTASGQVSGLTRTSACGNHGDSGGPFLTGGQAQGVLTHGPTNPPDPQGCYGDTYFQPLRPILTTYRLNLLVASGQLPTITGVSCAYHGSNNFSCGMNYVVPGAAPQITWKVGGVTRPGWDNLKTVSGSCTGTTTAISVTATNYAGSWTETRTVLCLGGGLPT